MSSDSIHYPDLKDLFISDNQLENNTAVKVIQDEATEEASPRMPSMLICDQPSSLSIEEIKSIDSLKKEDESSYDQVPSLNSKFQAVKERKGMRSRNNTANAEGMNRFRHVSVQTNSLEMGKMKGFLRVDNRIKYSAIVEDKHGELSVNNLNQISEMPVSGFEVKIH